ncbi:MAG: GNAT family N-acetyltransferase [Nocardioidaceae bacterium]
MTDVDPFHGWGDRTSIHDADGRVLLVYSRTESTRSGRPWADGAWRPARIAVEEAVRASMRELPGWAVSTADRELVSAYEADGTTVIRHAHAMSHDLSDIVSVPATDGLRLEPLSAAQLDRHAARLGALNFAAYPPDHPDHANASVEKAVSEMRAIGRGQVLGPLLNQSHIALNDGKIVGACIVVDRDGEAPEGGPWVIEIFRDPESNVRGIGRSLLTAVLKAAKRSGLPSLSLAVSHSNTRAFELYEALGFADASESWTLALPEPTA